jgi:hypothetical protein
MLLGFVMQCTKLYKHAGRCGQRQGVGYYTVEYKKYNGEYYYIAPYNINMGLSQGCVTSPAFI